MAGISKTPDEIKKGMECAVTKECILKECPYYSDEHSCINAVQLDAFAYIQQLEAQNAELLEKIKQLERERDAAIYDLERYSMCKPCKHLIAEDSKCPFTNDCTYGTKGRFEWRGLCDENGG